MPDETNPWEEVEQPQQSSLNLRNISEMTTNTASLSAYDGDEEFTTWMVRHWLYIFHLSDVVVGIVFMILACLEKMDLFPFIKANKLMEATTIVFSSVLLLRGLYACIPLFIRSKGHWVGAYRWSGRVSLLLCAAFIIAGIEEILRRVFDKHRKLGDKDKYIWIALLALGAFEFIRWVCVDNYRQIVTPIGHADDDDPVVPEITTSSRPWWISREKKSNGLSNENRLEEPLMGRPGWARGHDRSYVQDEGMDQQQQPRGFFARMFASSNPREEGASDFASVQEDWASRSEEDPLWWSKEGNDDSNASS